MDRLVEASFDGVAAHCLFLDHDGAAIVQERKQDDLVLQAFVEIQAAGGKGF